MGGRLQWRVNAVEEFCSGERGGLRCYDDSVFAVEGFCSGDFLQWGGGIAVEGFCSGEAVRC